MCVIDEEKPKCWYISASYDRGPDYGVTDIPSDAQDPFSIYAEANSVCVIRAIAPNEKNVQCWGSENHPRFLTAAQSVSGLCALDAIKGVVCWNDFGQYPVSVRDPIALSGNCAITRDQGLQC